MTKNEDGTDMKLIEFKIKRFKELITGILLGCGTRWSLVRLNVIDYVLDGLLFINKKYVVCENEIKEDTIHHKILTIKNGVEDMQPLDNPNILDDDNLLYTYLKGKELLVAVCLHCEDVVYVGKIKDVGQTYFVLDTYDTELRKSGMMKIEFTKVRYVQIHTDYLDSLCLLLGQGESQES